MYVVDFIFKLENMIAQYLFCSGGHTKENIRLLFVYIAANFESNNGKGFYIQNFEYESNFVPSLTSMK